MRIGRNSAVCSCVFIISVFVCVFLAHSSDPVSPIVVGYDAILRGNPLPSGEKIQVIRITGDETATMFLARFAPGVEVKRHFHKTHSEIVYFIQGTGRMIIDSKESIIKPGSIHFNPMNKVHSLENTGANEIVCLQIFTPAWIEPDRVPVP